MLYRANEGLELLFAVFASFVMWGSSSDASPADDAIHLQCLQIEGNQENRSYACDHMRAALMDRFADKTVSINPFSEDTTTPPENLVRFVFSEGQNQILYGRLDSSVTPTNASTPAWQVETRIVDTNNMRVGYKALVRALLTVNKLDQF